MAHGRTLKIRDSNSFSLRFVERATGKEERFQAKPCVVYSHSYTTLLHGLTRSLSRRAGALLVVCPCEVIPEKLVGWPDPIKDGSGTTRAKDGLFQGFVKELGNGFQGLLGLSRFKKG